MAQITNGINNQVGGSLSGATNQFLIANDSNTASSVALEIVRVGGGTAGDPFTQYTVTGATTFSEGIDNSDSDAFVIAASTALGTTNTVRIATTGEINFPLQSAFLALSGSASNVTGDGTAYTLGSSVALTEVYDQNSDFNTNGTYTAPVTGIAQFGGSITLLQIGAAHTDMYVLIQASNRTLTSTEVNATNYANPSGTANIPFCCNVDMDAADTCTFSITVLNGTKVVDTSGNTFIYGGILY